jgi:uncharacterized protein (DUF2147 family)
MKVLSYILMLAALAGFSSQTNANAIGPMGLWLGEDGKAKMEVAICGGETLCARIVWLRQPNDDRGQPLIDANNGDASLRRRPIIGLPVAYNMRQTHTNKWSGRVYDPQRGGQTYTGTMTLLSDGRMKVTGCLIFICESEYWQPLSKRLQN